MSSYYASERLKVIIVIRPINHSLSDLVAHISTNYIHHPCTLHTPSHVDVKSTFNTTIAIVIVWRAETLETYRNYH